MGSNDWAKGLKCVRLSSLIPCKYLTHEAQVILGFFYWIVWYVYVVNYGGDGERKEESRGGDMGGRVERLMYKLKSINQLWQDVSEMR